VYDLLWPHLLAMDMDEPRVILERRDKAKLQLARYGRVGTPGELLGWDDVEAVRVRRLHALLGEILESEGAGAAVE
jgi:hypothetical protein